MTHNIPSSAVISDSPSTEAKKCKYDKAWVGKCGKATTEEYCEEHKGRLCSVCKEKQATKECSHTGQFVCGFPLCDECRHNH